jgi:copper chaperone NosL
MRKYLIILAIAALFVGGSAVADSLEKPVGDCCAKGKQTDVTLAPAKGGDGEALCKCCRMDRKKFAHSRILIEYDDETTAATCSLRCAAAELSNNIDRTPRSIWVGDYATRLLIDAERAVWVIGGTKQGVMTRNPKWAFAGQVAAEAFVKENGGRLATFDEAMTVANGDLYQDTKMIRDKRKMMKKQLQ